MRTYPSLSTVQTINLQREQFQIGFRSRVKGDSYYDLVLDAYVTRLSVDVWSHHEPDVVIYVPRSWWEHFKRECFPTWLLRRLPIEYMEIRKRVIATYPSIRLHDGEHRARIHTADIN